MYYEHWKYVKNWRWPNFLPREIASRGDGSIIVDEKAMDMLQAARILAGKPFIINCGYRDELHNALVGGAPRSLHLQGRAFDISLKGHDKKRLIEVCKEAGFTGFGLNYLTFLHVDNGPQRSW